MSMQKYDADLIKHACLFATAAHAACGQVRKNSGEDYITHPRRVVMSMLFTDNMVTHISSEMLAAAWLHDVLEDTQVEVRTLTNIFPPSVVELVVELTNKEASALKPRAERKLADRWRLSQVSSEAQTIKYFDIWDNVQCFIEEDLPFAQAVYIPEKILMVEAMKGGCPTIRKNLLEFLFKNEGDLPPF